MAFFKCFWLFFYLFLHCYSAFVAKLWCAIWGQFYLTALKRRHYENGRIPRFETIGFNVWRSMWKEDHRGAIKRAKMFHSRPENLKKSWQKNSWNCIFGSFKNFPSSKINFWPFLKYQKMDFFFVKVIYLISRVFFGLDFFKFSGPLCMYFTENSSWWVKRLGCR